MWLSKAVPCLLFAGLAQPCAAGDGFRLFVDGGFLSLSKATNPDYRVMFDGNPSAGIICLGLGYAPTRTVSFGASVGYAALHTKKDFRSACRTCSQEVPVDVPRRYRVIPFELWLNVSAMPDARIHPVFVAGIGPTWWSQYGLDDGQYDWTGRVLGGVETDLGRAAFGVLGGWQSLEAEYGLRYHPSYHARENLSGWTAQVRLMVRVGS